MCESQTRHLSLHYSYLFSAWVDATCIIHTCDCGDACLHAFLPTSYTSICQVKPFIYSISVLPTHMSPMNMMHQGLFNQPPHFCHPSFLCQLTCFLLMMRLHHQPIAAPCWTMGRQRGAADLRNSAVIFWPMTHWWVTAKEKGARKCTPMLRSAHLNTLMIIDVLMCTQAHSFSS